MLLPTVAIIGRPNVGKSSLFNRLVGKPISIVDPTAGVTRDRVLHEVQWDEHRFDLIDTGGIGIVDHAKLEADVETQIERAIATADRIIFLVDGRGEITDLDQRIAARLRPYHERVVLAANKIDHLSMDETVHEFQKLGLGDPLPVSAEQRRGLDDLVELVAAGLPTAAELTEADSAAASEGRLKIALVGRRNVGKSSLTNALLGENRVIVADHAGTTRDAIDVRLDHETGRFLLIDTAGLRKKRQLTMDLEFYAACRTERAICRADVVFLVLDASEELGQVDKKIAHFCETEGRPTAIIINKWDLAEAGGAKREAYEAWLRDRLPGLAYAPVLYTCATEARHVTDILPLANELHEEGQQRVATSELNRLLAMAVSRRKPRRVGSSYTKLYYMTQIGCTPPSFTIFVNRADWIEAGYSRYLENYLRKRTPFKRVPMRIVFKARSSRFHEMNDENPVTTAQNKAERRSHLIIPGGSKRRKEVKRGRRGDAPSGGKPGRGRTRKRKP